MARVSENSATAAINYSVGKTKSAMEDLQIKGSNLKRIQKPSDDPAGNSELMTIRSRSYDNNQYSRNATYAKMQLNITESSLADLNNILTKVKEIAIGQSSNYYDEKIRKGVAYEVEQLREQALSIANKRIGNRYIFSGHKTLTRPFDKEGTYHGDKGKTQLEINKDVFVPINLTGMEVFFDQKDSKLKDAGPLENTGLADIMKHKNKASSEQKSKEIEERSPAGQFKDEMVQEIQPSSLFDHLQSLRNALVTNNHKAIQALLPELDNDFDRINSLRAKVGSLTNTVDNAEETQVKENIIQQERKSKIEDADVAKLFGELEKQKNILTATYKSGATLLNQSLLDFLR